VNQENSKLVGDYHANGSRMGRVISGIRCLYVCRFVYFSTRYLKNGCS